MAFAEPPTAGDPVRGYLARLEVALASQDPALRHDALVDAEVHLRDAIAAGASSERAIAEYGTPEEVAAAYVASEAGRGFAWRAPYGAAGGGGRGGTTGAGGIANAGGVVGAGGVSIAGGAASRAQGAVSVVPATSGSGPATASAGESRSWHLRDIPVVGIWFNWRAWGALAYFGAVGFVLSIAYFVWSVSIGALAIGLGPVVIGIPIFVLLLGSARALCLFEGKVVEFFLGVRMPRRVQPVAGVDEVGFWQRIWCWLRDVRSWMSLGYLLGNLLVSIVTFVLTVVLTASGAAFLAMPALWALGLPIANVEGADDMNIQILGQQVVPNADGSVFLPDAAVLPSLAVGFVTLTATLWMVRGLGWVYGHVVQAIQVARPQPAVPPKSAPG